jgi:hypothetical protein
MNRPTSNRDNNMTDLHLMNWMPQVGDTVYENGDNATVVAVSGQLIWIAFPYVYLTARVEDERKDKSVDWDAYNSIVHVNTITPFPPATDGGAA